MPLYTSVSAPYRHPSSLPSRIRLPDGSTRTSLHLLTEQELLDLGFKVAPEKPTFDPAYQYLSWNEQTGQWSVQNVDIDTIRHQKQQEAADHRFAVETGGFDLGNGVVVKTDRESQSLINGGYDLATRNPDAIIDWKASNGWVQLDHDTMVQIADSVALFVQMCFSVEKMHHDNIDQLAQAGDLASLAHYDVTTGYDQ